MAHFTFSFIFQKPNGKSENNFVGNISAYRTLKQLDQENFCLGNFSQKNFKVAPEEIFGISQKVTLQ